MRRPHHNTSALLIAALAVGWSGTVAAQEDLKARSWAASCAACHGTDGRSDSEQPPLAGKSKEDLVKMLKEFKTDQRKTATVMHQHAKGYTDEQLERIAEYFSRQKK